MVTPSSLHSRRRVLLHPLRLAFLEGRHRRLASDNNGPGQRVLDSFGACPNGRPRGPRQRQVRNKCNNSLDAFDVRIAPAGRGACVCDSGHLALQLAASKENVPMDSPTLLGIDDLRKSWSFANRLWSLMVITSSSHRAPTPR
jgi:hypothetical protein